MKVTGNKRITKKLTKLGSRLNVAVRKDENESGEVSAGSVKLQANPIMMSLC